MSFFKTLRISLVILIIFSLYPYSTYGQNEDFGSLHPLAPPALAQFDALIGQCHCKSVSRNQDGSWADTVKMTWTFKYIMDGYAVQDETIKEDGRHSGSIRQYNPDSSRWYVHYYSSGSAPPTLPSWEGGKTEDGKIILYRDQKAPNGMEGFYKITFSDMDDNGFNWLGEWVNKTETFSYPTWRIFCKKEKK